MYALRDVHVILVREHLYAPKKERRGEKTSRVLMSVTSSMSE